MHKRRIDSGSFDSQKRDGSLEDQLETLSYPTALCFSLNTYRSGSRIALYTTPYRTIETADKLASHSKVEQKLLSTHPACGS